MTTGATTRRPRGEGSIWEVTGANGTYWRGSVPLMDGTKKYFREDTQEAADAVRKILLQQALSGSLIRSSAIGKVRDEVRAWIRSREAAPGKDTRRQARKPLAPGTAKGYYRALDQLICRDKSAGMTFCLGDMKMDAVQQGHVQRWLDDLMDTHAKMRVRNIDDGTQRFADDQLSGSYLRQAYSVLSQTFDSLIRTGAVTSNPVKAVDRPTQGRTNSRPLRPDDLADILMAASNDRLYARWLIAFTLGLRPGEVIALRWDIDVDFESKTITVQGQLAEAGGIHYSPATKTEDIRVLPMGDSIYAALKDHREDQKLEKQEAGDSWKQLLHNENVVDLVFRGVDGRAISPRQDAKYWDKLVLESGIQGSVKRYVSRHTAASYLLADGTDAVTTASILGHSSPKMTLDVYAHAVPGTEKEAIKGLDARLEAARLRGQRRLLEDPDRTIEDINDEREGLGLELFSVPKPKPAAEEARKRRTARSGG